MTSLETNEYRFYDIIVRTFERLIKDLSVKDFQEVKNEVENFIRSIETDPEHINSTPKIQEILHYVKAASNAQELRRSLGAGIGESIKNKQLIRKGEIQKITNRRGPVREYHRVQRQVNLEPPIPIVDTSSALLKSSPNFRIDIGTPERSNVGTPNVRLDIRSERPTPERISGAGVTTEAGEETEAGEAPEENCRI